MPLSNPLRVIIYIRVSTDEQAREGHSLEAQLEICQNFAAQRGWEIVAVHRDPLEGQVDAAPDAPRRKKASSSGKNDRRPGFQQMIADVRAGRADVVLTHKLDRFSRSISDILLYLREFNTLGAAYTSATESFDFTTPIGKVLLVLLAAFAEWYLDNLSAETSKGKRKRAAKGYWNGDLSFGYRVAADGLHAEHDPATAPGVVLAFQEFATGLYGDLEIARILNAANYRTRGKQGSIPFSKDTVRAMLQNPFYVGQVRYKEEVFAGNHPPLIDQDLWDRCQAIRRRRSLAPRVANPRTRIYPLAGLTYCIHCKRAHRGQQIGAHRYYRDSDRDHDGDCPHPRFTRAGQLEEQVAAELMRCRLPDRWKEIVFGQVPVNRDGDEVARRRARAEAKIQRANELYLEQLIERKDYDKAMAEAKAEIDSLRPVSRPNLEHVANLLDDLPELWDRMLLEERKTLFQAMLERVYVRGSEIVALQPTPDLFPLLQLVYSGPDGIRTRDLGLDRAAC